MATATSSPPATDSTAGRGVRIAAKERCAGLSEPFEMDLMTNSVAGARMIDAGLGGDGLQVQMIVMVLRPESSHVMIDVADR